MTFILGTVVVTICVVTLGILLYMSFMSADRTGWRTLATKYRLRDRGQRFRGKKHHFCTAVMNGFAFHGVLVVGVSADGLVLHPFWMLRAFHPALLFPWNQLTARPFARTHDRGVRVELLDSIETEEGLQRLVLEWSEKTHGLVASHLPAA